MTGPPPMQDQSTTGSTSLRPSGRGLFARKTPEEKAQEQTEKQAEREQRQREAAAEKERKRIQGERDEFFRSPAGQARSAFDEGDQVFQYAIDVMRQRPIIISMIGSRTSKRTNDPVAILNSVCREGWELVNGSFVFVEEGQQSRDKLMSSGQNVAIKGTTMGYYLFKRCEANATERVNPWEQQSAEPTEIVGVEVAP